MAVARELGAASPSTPAQRQALAQAIGAAALAAQGRWSDAERLFDAAFATLRKATGKRPRPPGAAGARAGVRTGAARAGHAGAHLDKALKFCLTEGGKRDPVLDTPLGAIALAIQMRLGVVPRDLKPFLPYGSQWGYRSGVSRVVSPLDLGRWLMRSWLKEGSMAEPLPPGEADAAQHLKSALDAAGLDAQAEQLDAAMRVLAGEGVAPAWFFVPAGLRALAGRARGAARARRAGRRAGRGGRDHAHRLAARDRRPRRGARPRAAGEQARRARLGARPKEISLTKLQRGATLAPRHDAAVIRAIRAEALGRGLRLRPRAGGRRAGRPSVRGVRRGARRSVRRARRGRPGTRGRRRRRAAARCACTPALQVAADSATPRWGGSEAERKELEALRLVSVWRDGPQRARLVRLSPSQKRVAQLLGPDGLDLPRQGAMQLQEVLAGLGSHFRIHADDAATAQAAREVAPESRLRAELQPIGDGLQLRLVAAPFGAEYASVGPRLVPGRGRARVVATLKGESLGVQRDLAREREHLGSVLETCPMLDELPLDAPCEWQLDTPDDALGLLERLQQHHAIIALDWPQGRPVRVAAGALPRQPPR